MFCTTEEKNRRITLDHCRNVLGESEKTDAELEQMRHALYALAEVAVDAYMEKNAGTHDADDQRTGSADREYDDRELEAVAAIYNVEAAGGYSALGATA